VVEEFRIIILFILFLVPGVSEDGSFDYTLLVEVAAPLGSLFFFLIGSLVLWCKYKRNYQIFKWISYSSEEYYNISRATCKFRLCFACNIVCSSCMCCCHRCSNSSHKSCDNENHNYDYGDDQPNDLPSPGGVADRGTASQFKFTSNDIENLIDITFEPVSSGSELKNFTEKDFPTSEEKFVPLYEEIVNKLASRVTFQQFQADYMRYSQFFGKMSHTSHCKNKICYTMNHKFFEATGGIRLQPVIYFLVINFVELLYLFKKEKELDNDINKNSDRSLNTLFKLILSGKTQSDIKQDLKTILTKNARYNVWLTLLNFPEPSQIQTLEEKYLRGIIVQFMSKLEVHNANLVVRGSNLMGERENTMRIYER